MDGIKKVVVFFAIIMLVIAFTAPVMAQMYGGRMAQPQAGEQQAMPQQEGQELQAMPQQGGQGQQGGVPQSDKDLMATMEGRSDISMFTAAVKAAGYDQMLSQQSQDQNPYMVFAPTDESLQRDMGIADADALVSDTNSVKNLVENCIVTNVKQPAEGSKALTMTTVGGMKLTAMKSDKGITVNGIKVVEPAMATNGLLAVTDGVVGMKSVKPRVMPSVAPGGMRGGMPGGMRGGMPGGMQDGTQGDMQGGY
jgi:uncharacterized surface protein with fasciclin (FAS1) repeats